MPSVGLTRLKEICRALDGATEVKSWGAPTFRVDGRLFAMYAAPGNNHGGRESVWLYCDSTNQMLMIADKPDRFFKPAYVGPYGWVGVYLDKRVNWTLVKSCVQDAYEARLTKSAKKQRAAAGRKRTRQSRPKAKPARRVRS